MEITVFTPTYNRASMLPRLFHSLQAQTCKEFEWLVVDDGSKDATGDTISGFQKEADFPIRYYRKENGGKHTAYNMALEQAHGKWIMCLDSDDILKDDAVEKLCSAMENQQDTDGVVAYKSDFDGKLIGDVLPQVQSLHIPELGTRYHCSGDYVFAYDATIAKRFPFPVFPGERFAPEGIMLDLLGQECRVAVLPEILMVCEYQSDGYSAQVRKLIKDNPCAYTQCFMQRIDISLTMNSRIMNAGKYHCYRLFTKGNGSKYCGKHKWLTMCCFPIGLVFYLYYKLLCGF